MACRRCSLAWRVASAPAANRKLWAGGSFGLRMPVVVLGPARLMAEGRWRSLTILGRNGIEVGIAVGYRAKRGGPPRPESAGLWVPPPIADILRARGIPEAKARLLGNVVTTALEEMGQPYVWGAAPGTAAADSIAPG